MTLSSHGSSVGQWPSPSPSFCTTAGMALPSSFIKGTPYPPIVSSRNCFTVSLTFPVIRSHCHFRSSFFDYSVLDVVLNI
jgi:hypothetical protein